MTADLERTMDIRQYPEALTVAEAAEILRVSTKTVYKLIRSGMIPSVKVGRENRIAKTMLMRHLRQARVVDTNLGEKMYQKSSGKRWTCTDSCGIVRVAKRN